MFSSIRMHICRHVCAGLRVYNVHAEVQLPLMQYTPCHAAGSCIKLDNDEIQFLNGDVASVVRTVGTLLTNLHSLVHCLIGPGDLVHIYHMYIYASVVFLNI